MTNRLAWLRKLVILLTGTTLLAAGVAMIVLPGPAIVVIPMALAVLSLEFAWARRLLRRFKDVLPTTKHDSVISQAQVILPAEHRGLSAAESRDRLVSEGPNELPTDKPKSFLSIALEVVREPMFVLLLVAGGLYLSMGDTTDAAMLLGFVFVVLGITAFQQQRTERALGALRDLSSPRALVLRDGAPRRIAGREVVRGDRVILSEGDRVPADGILRESTNISIDESILTGESMHVRKVPSNDREMRPPGGEGKASVFSGTLVTSGQGIAEIVRTGANTELGKIGKSIREIQHEKTLLQNETDRVVRALAIAGLITCAAVIAYYGITRGGTLDAWRQGLLTGITMAMSILPEEFPVILSVFLALGAWRISRANVLTRRLPAIETLGAATVLCVDKTGTLTRNEMTVRTVICGNEPIQFANEMRHTTTLGCMRLMNAAVLASKRDPYDPMERAIHNANAKLSQHTLYDEFTEIVKEFPLTPSRLAVTHLWKTSSGSKLYAATKGAPEAIARLCRLTKEQRASMLQQVTQLASSGMRVLGVADKQFTAHANSPEEIEFEYLGLIALEDPLRDSVPAAMAECRRAGIRVVMITGDYPNTAESVARRAGIDDSGASITGEQLQRMSDEELRKRAITANIFARVAPEQKLRIVNALKAEGQIVAMTGDGVNDAPALKAAHIGIAMGKRGTDVAREASALVLLNDDFASIVAAIRLGRRIFDNIRKAIAFTFAAHLPIAGLSILPVFIPGWPPLLLPIHIVFLEMIINPACALVFEAEEAEADVMERPPRNQRTKLFTVRFIGIALLEGISALIACIAVLLLSRQGHTTEVARGLVFVALVISFLMIIVAIRSDAPGVVRAIVTSNKAFKWVVLSAIVMLGFAIFVPAIQEVFHFAPLHTNDLLLSIGAGVVSVLWVEALEHWVLRRKR